MYVCMSVCMCVYVCFYVSVRDIDSIIVLAESVCNVCADEVHAEICYAECLLERAVLNFIKDENLIGFIKGSLKIKECYSLYK